MRRRSRLLSIAAAGGLAAFGFAAGPVTHAFAGVGPGGSNNGSPACEDSVGQGDDYPILTTPITLGVEIQRGSTFGSGPGAHVAICYATSPYQASGPETTGGAIAVDALYTTWSNPGGNTVNATCTPDGNPQGVALACQAGSTPTYTLTPGPVGTTGDTVSVSIPFDVCFGSCTGTGAGLSPTGLLVGQLVPTPEPGIGVGYSLESLDVFVNGTLVFHEQPTTVAGAYVNPLGAVAESLNFSQGGPCLSNECVPDGYVATTGSNVVGFQVLGLPVNVAVPKQCVYQNPSGSCP